jgi:hypothetical protein
VPQRQPKIRKMVPEDKTKLRKRGALKPNAVMEILLLGIPKQNALNMKQENRCQLTRWVSLIRKQKVCQHSIVEDVRGPLPHILSTAPHLPSSRSIGMSDPETREAALTRFSRANRPATLLMNRYLFELYPSRPLKRQLAISFRTLLLRMRGDC